MTSNTTTKAKNKGGAPKGNKNAVGNKGGRPTKWNCEDHNGDTLDKTREYLESCVDKGRSFTREEIPALEGKENEKKEYELVEHKAKVNIPSVQGLAAFLKVSGDTLYEWAVNDDGVLTEKERIEFSDTLEELKNIQGNRLISKGLSGDYNPTIAKLLLSSNHGMAEKTESKNETELKGDFLTDIHDAIAKNAKN